MGQKRKWLAALLVLAMLVSVMPLAVFAEGEGEECKSDHSNVTCAEPCAECDYAPEHQYNKGICTVCNAEEPTPEHTCTPANDWSKDKNGHWHACADPNCVVKSDYAEHVYGTEGTCVCGATKPAHTCTPANDWSNDKTGHWHACTGEGCDKKIAYQEHTYDKNHECAVCGYSLGYCMDVNEDCECDICGEACHGWSVEPGEEKHYWVCWLCGYSKEEDHEGMDDGVCDDCGYGCEHEHTKYFVMGQTGHLQICLDCGQDIGDILDHDMINGKCTVCGYAPCEEGEHSYDRNAGVYERHTCQKCGFVEDHVDKDKDCVCDICSEDDHDIQYIDNDTDSHWSFCLRHGKINEENHFDLNDDGICDSCGYSCKHENVEYKNETLGQHGHTKLCVDCGEYLGNFEHTMENGKCSGCGYAPCAEGKHFYDPEAEGYDRHRCQNCGFIEDHVDEDDDCVCETCGQPCHKDEIKHNETHCWLHCNQCGWEDQKGEHYDSDNDQKCDRCEYDMSSSSGGDSAKDESLDDVPKTGDITGVILAAAMTAFGGSGAALLKRKFTL